MVLAAGFGKRLGAVTAEIPKPLLWLGDGPVIAHVLGRVREVGPSVTVVNTHHLRHVFRVSPYAEHLRDVIVTGEERILGTAGGIQNARIHLVGDVLVHTGDVVTNMNLAPLVRAHQTSGAYATLAIAPRSMGEGTVGMDANGQVARLRSSRAPGVVEQSGGLGLGIFVLSQDAVRDLPHEGCLVADALAPALDRGRNLRSFAFNGSWSDIGTPKDYMQAIRTWLGECGLTRWIADAAEVSVGVDLSGSIVAPGARVTGYGVVRESVVLPGAIARAPLERSIVLPSGTRIGC